MLLDAGDRQMPRQDKNARGVARTLTAEPQDAVAVGKRHDDIAVHPRDACHAGPDHAEIAWAAEFQPATRQMEMTERVALSTSKPYRRHQVAPIAGSERFRAGRIGEAFRSDPVRHLSFEIEAGRGCHSRCQKSRAIVLDLAIHGR